MSDLRNIIVIGASAGGIPALKEVVSGLKADDAAVLVVLHLSRNSNSEIIASGLRKHTPLTCVVGSEGMELRKGYLYIAPPEHQMMVKDDTIRINQGPHENRYRPSIDVLFRSAAVNYRNRVVGIILTGMLDDGTSGMWAIKRSGGICIVQDPSEAQFPDMPRSVINKMDVDHLAPVADIPALVNEILDKPLPPDKPVPYELKIEADLTERMMSDINQLKAIADQSDFICPDCGGGLWAVKDDPTHRYRCHTGHVFNEKLLQDLQDENIEESVWVCIRMLEEKYNLLMLMANREKKTGDTRVADAYQRRLDDLSKHISRFKSLLSRLTEDLHDQKILTSNHRP
ncbi:MAG TPA: chemotaxis protein CheB [Flavobacterium sp.]|jgi:two-component system chemotaxis response regulator CheB